MEENHLVGQRWVKSRHKARVEVKELSILSGNDKCVYAVIRIQKSASTTLSDLVRNAFADARCYSLPNSYRGNWTIGTFQKLRYCRSRARLLLSQYGTLSLDSALAEIDRKSEDGDIVTGGHIDFHTFERLNTKKKYITIFRHPINRLISEYNYCRNAYNNKLFINRFDLAFDKKIAGKNDIDWYVSVMLEHKEMFGNIAASMIGVTKSEQINNKLKNGFFHFGVLEDFSDFTQRLEKKIGKTIFANHTNKTKKNSVQTVNSDTRRKIEKLYDLDFEIYEQAKGFTSH